MGAVNGETRTLWHVDDVECVMISCCAGAELQVRRLAGDTHRPGQPVETLLRELYPTKSDLYERARGLEAEYRARS
jgi:hypothetical protein